MIEFIQHAPVDAFLLAITVVYGGMVLYVLRRIRPRRNDALAAELHRLKLALEEAGRRRVTEPPAEAAE